MHGPLARLELGQQKVQGVDYAYTLQGWLKGINASQIDPGRDMGRDRQVSGHNPLVSRDAYGFSLGYFEQDFEPIGNDPFEADYHPSGGSSFGDLSYKNGSLYDRGLYNGNIRHSVVALDSMNYPNIGYVYSYDQLNRLTGQVAFTDLDNSGNEWGTASAVDDYKENVWYDPNGNITSYMRHGTTSGGSMDEMTYNYGYGSNNQLSHVDDAIPAGTYPADIDDQADSNYTYDASGNLIADVSEGITNDWTTAGKLQRVTKTGMVIEFRYDAMGNRVSKNVTDNTDSVTTYYVRDAQGNVMAVYQYADNAAELRLKELHMYGSSRVGIRKEDEIIWCQSCTLSVSPVSSAWAGRQIYELTNHLGNVLTTVSDKKVHFDNNNDNIADWSVPEIVSQNDYFPGGMSQPGRIFSADNYRYGFNGQEKVDEISGIGNHTTAKFWEYDSRIGKRWNTDPVVDPSESPYATNKSNPVKNNDPNGDCSICPRLFTGALAATVDASVQFSVYYSQPNATFTSAIKQVDAADIGISFVEGFSTYGRNIPKLLTKKGVAEGAKAAVDVTPLDEDQVQVVGGDKPLDHAVIDFGTGMAANKAAGEVVSGLESGIGKDITSGTFSTLTKGEKQTLRNVQKTVESESFQTTVEGTAGLGTQAIGETMKTDLVTPSSLMPSATPQDNTTVIKTLPQ